MRPYFNVPLEGHISLTVHVIMFQSVPTLTSIIHMTAHDKDEIDKGKLTYSLEGGKIYIINIMHIQLLVLNYPVYFSVILQY